MSKSIIKIQFILLFFYFQNVMAVDDHYFMYAGEVKIYEIKNKVERVAVGNGKLLSTSITQNGQLILIAEGTGDTNIHIWTRDSKEIVLKVFITDTDTSRIINEIKTALTEVENYKIQPVGSTIQISGKVAVRYKYLIDTLVEKYKLIDLVQYAYHGQKVDITEKTDPSRIIKEIRAALIEVKNYQIRPVGNTIQISGKVAVQHKPLIDKLVTKYDLIDLVKYDYFGRTFEVLQKALQIIPDIDIVRTNEMIILKGQIEEKYLNLINTIINAFPDVRILNLTEKADVAKGKMIYMNVRITEFSNNDLAELGIAWDKQIAGPNSFYSNGSASGISLDSVFKGGFFGIATEITSRINLLISKGDAVLLAEPRLSAYSGGKAEFISGGELPIPITNADGSISVEYKQYGIILKIEPFADDSGNISAHVETELSAVDASVTVNGIPGIKQRSTISDVRMKDKQTLVIAGLVNNDISKDVSQLPWLGDIPVLGKLFSSNKFRNNNTQLVIFVTPIIYDAKSELNQNYLLFEQQLKQKFLSKLGMREIVD